MEGFAMITCEEVSTLISTDALQAQSAWRRMNVRLHLMMCRHCRRFARQVALLGRAARDLGAIYDAEMALDFEDRIRNRVRR